MTLWNDWWVKYMVSEMSDWWNGWLMRWLFDKMSFDEMTSLQND